MDALPEITARVEADSINENGNRITTLVLKYPRFFHSEFMTHRVFSRSASSSRAIPIKKVLAQVWNNPAMPLVWGSNKAGMQAGAPLAGFNLKAARSLWKYAGRAACVFAWGLMKVGLHKQHANRILEPWQYIHVVVTSTEWKNFMGLRNHHGAQPEIRELALVIKDAMVMSVPKLLHRGEWHLPFVTADDRRHFSLDVLRQLSAARCCRVSYLRHDGLPATTREDQKLCADLVLARPIHASPFEHQATPDSKITIPSYAGWENPDLHRNLVGWIQNRALVEGYVQGEVQGFKA